MQMIFFKSEKVKDEWEKSAVALRLIVETLSTAYGRATFIIRVGANTKFENGVHSTGLAMDVELKFANEMELLSACSVVNKKFSYAGPGIPIATPKINLSNFPSGQRIDRPHVHIQIPLDWKVEPRRFLEKYGYLKSNNSTSSGI